MCFASAVGDHFTKEWTRGVGIPTDWDAIRRINEGLLPIEKSGVSVVEFERLKQQVKDMTALLKVAVDYDQRTGQPNCEVEQKIEMLRMVASAFKIDLDAILNG